jgi:hypothetical protein
MRSEENPFAIGFFHAIQQRFYKITLPEPDLPVISSKWLVELSRR